MARIPGRLGRVAVSNDNGATFVLLGCVTDATLDSNLEELENTCKESGQYREYLPGRKDASIDLTMMWDEQDVGQNILGDAHDSSTQFLIRFRMEEGSNKKENVARAQVSTYGASSPNDGMAELSVTVRLTGDYSSALQV